MGQVKMSGMDVQGIALLLFVISIGFHVTESCSGRKVFNDTWGIITDGTGKYPASAHCEWLIKGV